MASMNPYNRPGIGRPVQAGGILHPVLRTGAYASGGVGLGPGNTRHHHRRNPRWLRDNIRGITKNSIRKMARRGGVKRVQIDIYDTIRAVIKGRLEAILGRICIMLDDTGRWEQGPNHSMLYDTRRKTVTTLDVIFALKQMGNTLYGFDWYELGREKTKKKRRPVIEDDEDL